MKRQAFCICAAFLMGSLLMHTALAFNNSPVEGIHQDLQSQMVTEEHQILPQIEALWRSTLQRNPSLQIALEKIAEKTGKVKPKDKIAWTEKMLQGIIQIGGIGGSMLASSPAPLVGSTILGRMTAPDQSPQRLTMVTSADLVVLTREIEQVQSQLVLNYLQFQQAQDEVTQLKSSLSTLETQSKPISQESPQTADMINVILLNQKQKLQQAEETVQTYRNLLVLAAGDQAVSQVEKSTARSIDAESQAPSHAPSKQQTR